MTSFKKISENKYKLYVELGYNEKGKRIRKTKTVTVTSPRDLKKKIQAFELEVLKEPGDDYESMTFEQLTDRWFNDYVLKNLAFGTIASYTNNLPFIKAFFGKIQVKKIKRLHIQDFFNDEEKNNRKSLSIKLTILQSIFGKAEEWDLIDFSPARKYKLNKKKIEKEPEFYNKEELLQLFEELEKESLRDRLIIKLGVYGGLRRGEIMGISFDDIDFKNNEITIQRSLNYDTVRKIIYVGPTKGKKKRTIEFPEGLMKELKSHYLKMLQAKMMCGNVWETIDGVDVVFRSRKMVVMNPNSVTRQWNDIINRLGLKKKIKLHGLRHSAASLLISEGVGMKTVQTRLGHSRYETTMNTYVHVTEKDKDEAVKALNEVFK